eukprot:1148038-Pelagomonas_calceolata.AAC.3
MRRPSSEDGLILALASVQHELEGIAKQLQDKERVCSALRRQLQATDSEVYKLGQLLKRASAEAAAAEVCRHQQDITSVASNCTPQDELQDLKSILRFRVKEGLAAEDKSKALQVDVLGALMISRRRKDSSMSLAERASLVARAVAEVNYISTGLCAGICRRHNLSLLVARRLEALECKNSSEPSTAPRLKMCKYLAVSALPANRHTHM